MSYTALYRKFRPDNFLEVKGQEHIVTTLKNQVKAGRIGHAYLFCGTRGTGKTTIAKLLAKVVNCENPIDGNPCNACKMCKGIASGTSMNVIEIDAASNNGVDNVREIVEEVRYSPTEGRYKVYIVDEVHMLSAGAFNALLKTIEEPPSYVIFILATTEVHKIPITILSRCQRYDFRRITIDIITQRLVELMDVEKVEAEEKALRYVARVADGSMRDALSLLDQCISFYLGKRLTYDNVLEVLGAVDTQVFSRLLGYIRTQDVASCIKLLEEIESLGRELGQFTIDLIWYMRNLLLIKTTKEVSELIFEISTENLELLKQEATLIEEQSLIRYIRIFSELSNQIRYATRKKVLVEIALIKLCKPEMEQNLESVNERLRMLEQKIENGVMMNVNTVLTSKETSEKQPSNQSQTPKTPVILAEAVDDDLKEAASKWQYIKAQIAKKSPSLGPILNSTTLSVDGKSLQLVVNDPYDKDMIERENHMLLIKDTIAQILQKQVQITTRYLDRTKERMDEVVDLTKIIKAPIEYE